MATECAEARAFVETVMNVHNVTPVVYDSAEVLPSQEIHASGVINSGLRRKRPDSDEVGDSPVKKSRRQRMRRLSKKISLNESYSSADSEYSAGEENSQLIALLVQISQDVKAMFKSLTDRMDALENNLEKKITSKLTQALDKRLTVESNKLRKDLETKIDSRMESLRSDVTADVVGVHDEIEAIKTSIQTERSRATRTDTLDIRNNVIIRNLSEGANENIASKVNGLIKDGLKVRNVQVESAVRKDSRSSSKPGVVVATFKTASDKKAVMTSKPYLRESRTYKDVYINHDIPREERLMSANFKTLVDAVRGRRNDVSIRGTRVVIGENAASRQSQDVSPPWRRDSNERGRNNGSQRSDQTYRRQDGRRRGNGTPWSN